jgi:hypothetical protein
MEFLKVTSDFYCCTLIGNDFKDINPDQVKFCLGIFSFFGTLVQSEKGLICDYKDIILTSPLIKENLFEIKNKGYTICILEYVNKNKLNKLLNVIRTFYQTIQNTITIHFFVFTDKSMILDGRIYDGLISYFNPKNNKFEPNSFYCGFKMKKIHHYPWFRYNSEDLTLGNNLKMKVYNPHETIGYYPEVKYAGTILYITCGQEFSGYEIEYESFRSTKIMNGIIFRHKIENNVNIFAIKVEDLPEIFNFEIEYNESIVVFGSNPRFDQRQNIRNKFPLIQNHLVLWYGKYPYKKVESFSSYRKNFQNPLLYGELFFRQN